METKDWSNDSNALRQANKQLEIQNNEKEKRAAELLIANLELAFQNEEKEKRAAELIIANKELSFQNSEKEKRAAELIVANKELALQNAKQKTAENHLRLLESVITHANDAVLITDATPIDEPGPRIVYVNQAFTKMTGYEASEVVGQTPRLLQGVRTDRVQLARIRNALNRHESIEVEIVNYKKNGEEFWNNFALVPVMDKDKRLTHCVSIQRDVTSRRQQDETTRKRLELLVEERTRELNEALRKEKDLVELKSRFVSIASHEFRTPLSTIGFAAESIRNYFHKLTTEEIKAKLRKIEDQASHMTNLLEDVLTVGKSDAGKIKVHLVSLDLREFIESLIEETRTIAKIKRKISFVYSCAPGNINADDKLFRNVFTNLLTNAIKFSSPESVIRVLVSDREKDILIEVADEGIGIEENELTSIFESFQRGSNASAVPGSGLGLSILKKAVELMNGSIEVKSLIGKGSTFKVRIPKR